MSWTRTKWKNNMENFVSKQFSGHWGAFMWGLFVNTTTMWDVQARELNPSNHQNEKKTAQKTCCVDGNRHVKTTRKIMSVSLWQRENGEKTGNMNKFRHRKSDFLTIKNKLFMNHAKSVAYKKRTIENFKIYSRRREFFSLVHKRRKIWREKTCRFEHVAVMIYLHTFSTASRRQFTQLYVRCDWEKIWSTVGSEDVC